VIRGDEDTYLIRAKGGQKMSVKISSVERNAAFLSKSRAAVFSKTRAKAMIKQSGKARFPVTVITKSSLPERAEMPLINYP